MKFALDDFDMNIILMCGFFLKKKRNIYLCMEDENKNECPSDKESEKIDDVNNVPDEKPCDTIQNQSDSAPTCRKDVSFKEQSESLKDHILINYPFYIITAICIFILSCKKTNKRNYFVMIFSLMYVAFAG